ncbi:lipopolysaccharide biosynthesis protein [Acidimangrovimonas pyrenivorans]|uniref:Lipopolysaccharide biosynthesis protein n=1 Tax=Acidimangrovimonas pyrenivorans TaxID=2030798 RepID=A0ABV7AHC1_9RHOB
MTYRRLLGGGSLVTLGNVTATGLGLLLLLLLGRSLEPAELAIVMGVIAVIDGGQMFLDASVNTGMVNLAARRGTTGAPSPDLLRAGLWSKLIAGLIYAVIAALAARPMSIAMVGDASIAPLIAVAGGAALVAGMQGFILALLTAHEAFGRIALVSTWKNAIRILVVLPFLLRPEPDPWTAALAICGATVVTFLFSVRMVSWSFLRDAAPLREGLAALLRVNRWMALAALAMLGGRLDLWLVGWLGGAGQAGHFAVAAQLCVGVGVVTQALVTTLLPTISRFENAGQVREFMVKGSRVLLPVLLLPLAAWLLAEPAMVLFVGPGYADSAPIFVVLLTASVMTLVGAPLMLVLLTLGEARILALGAMMQMGLRVAFAIPLVASAGGVGMAVADVLSRLIAMAAIGVFVWRALRRGWNGAGAVSAGGEAVGQAGSA